MPIRKVSGGYKWGKHGHVYKNRAGAERQQAAIFANGYREEADATRSGLTDPNPPTDPLLPMGKDPV